MSFESFHFSSTSTHRSPYHLQSDEEEEIEELESDKYIQPHCTLSEGEERRGEERRGVDLVISYAECTPCRSNDLICSLLLSSLVSRNEIGNLSETQTYLARQLHSIRASLQQFQRHRHQIRHEVREIERGLDEIEEAAEGATVKEGTRIGKEKKASNATKYHLRTVHSLHAESNDIAKDWDLSMEALSQTSREIEELLLNGKITISQSTQPKQFASTSASNLSSPNGFDSQQSHLPSMSVEKLGSFDEPNNQSKLAPTSTTVLSSSPTDMSTSSAWLIHQSDLLHQYLTSDDEWAKSLNELFKSLFDKNSGDSHSPMSSSSLHGSTLDDTVRHSSAHAEIESIVRSTPHIQKWKSRSGTSLETVTPARGRIGDKHSTGNEKGFHTPPVSTSHATQSSSPSSSSSHTHNHGAAASSTIAPALHAQYSAELTRLYHSFPDSQDYWLCHNLLFLGVKAKIEEQHSIMVKDDLYKSMSRQQLNEMLAEVGMQVAAMTKQLASILAANEDKETNDDDTMNGAAPPLTSSISTPNMTSFHSLWHRLRSLQLVEVMRADLVFAHRRQEDYLAEQRKLQHILIHQRARHELLLGLWRHETSELHRLKELIQSIENELFEELLTIQSRHNAYRQALSAHATTNTIHSTSRLTIDGRATFMKRLAQLYQNGTVSIARQLQHLTAEEAKEIQLFNDHIPSSSSSSIPSSSPSSSATSSASSSTSAPSFDVASMLSHATFLSSFNRRFGQLLDQTIDSQSRHAFELNDFGELCRIDFIAAGNQHQREDIKYSKCYHNGHSSARSSSSHRDADFMSVNLDRLNSNEFQTSLHDLIESVDSITTGLNELNQTFQLQREAIDSHGDEAHSATLQLQCNRADIQTRTVWTEFIQAPERLEERVELLKKQLTALEMR